jgi:hypothetical protein
MFSEDFDTKQTQLNLFESLTLSSCLGGRQFIAQTSLTRSGLKLREPTSTSKSTTVTQLQLPAAARLNMASEDEQYHPKDSVKAAINGTLITGAAGTLVSAVQNTLTKRNVGAWGVFTRSGGTIAVFGGSCSSILCF